MENGHSIPVFLTKLYTIVQGNQEQEILRFDESGRILVLADQERLQQYLLPEYFGHKNLPSFLRYYTLNMDRQLNMYGFKKRHNNGVLEFKHKYFRRDGKQGLQVNQDNF
ncbi:unnamed protein product (macronuclear) [Paramecium tetraurelia]|uniref:HSF-type DNA-binding domain-containing protein n=1 Tax=Paramecium tetraurelia TaxID=5888 RepID=A0E788_PARTE|nr:uncharacterized protein GSPATT00023883001 [Paramecium tetraurelia]CAK91155.1 unnamed protein product [Paramecium tetraurelia]|eukprot:XP_001458552.1 hypothetical protein (macronuclear) [Paramecium tetraurelia strain d4-2]